MIQDRVCAQLPPEAGAKIEESSSIVVEDSRVVVTARMVYARRPKPKFDLEELADDVGREVLLAAAHMPRVSRETLIAGEFPAEDDRDPREGPKCATAPAGEEAEDCWPTHSFAWALEKMDAGRRVQRGAIDRVYETDGAGVIMSLPAWSGRHSYSYALRLEDALANDWRLAE